MTRARVIQLAIAAAVALGLVAAIVLRAPSAPPEVEARALPPEPVAPPAEPPVAPTPPPAPSPPPSPAKSAVSAPSDEVSLMTQLRSLAVSDRPRAIELAREGDQRFPESPDAPERTSILIHALAGEGNASEARRTAEDMVNRYPDSNWVKEIEQFTGAHRYLNRNLRLNADGGLEYY